METELDTLAIVRSISIGILVILVAWAIIYGLFTLFRTSARPTSDNLKGRKDMNLIDPNDLILEKLTESGDTTYKFIYLNGTDSIPVYFTYRGSGIEVKDSYPHPQQKFTSDYAKNSVVDILKSGEAVPYLTKWNKKPLVIVTPSITGIVEHTPFKDL